MLTFNTMRAWSAIQEQTENESTYNWYKNNIGMSGLAQLYGIKKSGNAPIMHGKSKEYNLINREYTQCIAEVELYKQSLDNPINDMQRKIRDIDRINPNNFEDYKESVNTLITLKKEQLNAITQKAGMIKNKHELLLKTTKQENDLGNGNNNGGFSNPATSMASVLKSLPSANNYSDAVFHGEMDIETARAKSAEAERMGLVSNTNEGYDLGKNEVSMTANVSPYMIAKTKYGESVQEKYCVDPKSGFGYVKFVDPEGNSGVKESPLGLFKTQYVDYGSKSVIDAAKIMYEVEEVDTVPQDVEKQWLEIFPDGVNRLAARQ